MKEEKSTGTKGMSFVGVLTLIFIVLKLTGLITWSWIWVLSPLWIGFAVTITLMLLFLFFCIVVTALNDAINDD